ncbi:MAG: S9 family peptidase [Bacteroidales bacterium]|nr:S9 family peptidase [Bacteroidales bacterium]
MKKLFILISLFSVYINVFSQKIELDHDVYDSWKSLEEVKLSNDGRYTSYQVNPQKGDGKLIIFDNEQKANLKEFDRAYSQNFSSMGDFIVFKVKPQEDSIRKLKIANEKKENFPKDSLYVYSISQDTIWKFPRVKSYQIAAEEIDILCFVHEKEQEKKDDKESSDSLNNETENSDSIKIQSKKLEGTKLVLFNLKKGIISEYDNVVEYLLSENGQFLLYKNEIPDSVDSVYVHLVNTITMENYCVMKENAYAKGLSFDKFGTQFSFYFSSDTAKEKIWSIKIVDTDSRRVIDILSEKIMALPHGWKISENYKLSFTEDGKKLYFGTSFVLPVINNDSIPDDEIAKLDIWSWHDDRIMSHQLKSLDDDKKKTFACVFEINSNSAIQIADSLMDIVNLRTKSQHDLVLGYTQIPYLDRIQWSMETFRDYYIVNTINGKRTLFAKDFSGSVSLSPGGNFAALYNKSDSAWYFYDVKRKITYPVAHVEDVVFYNDEQELPMPLSHFGIAGWLKNDRAILVYDEFDIWQFNCGKDGESKNLTNGFGAANSIELRYVKTDSELDYIDDESQILIKGFNKKNKNQSLYYLNLKNGELTLLVNIPYNISNIKKSKENEVFLFAKSDYTTYPDLYLVNDLQNWGNSYKISDANPQMQNYKWGSVEPYEWIDFNGDTVSGLLYKPEDFNPANKYPMIIYFYEKYSDRLHTHYTPRPSRSVISFPLFVSKGYLIFIPDINYTIGQPGKDAYNSIVSGAYSLIEKGFVDKDKIGLQGQSWGGYQVAYLVTQTDLFACAMAGAPVSNMTSAYGGIRMESGHSRMMQYEQGQSRIGGTLWDNLPQYIGNSPVFYADKVNTPLLIMHNDGDGAVPFSQGVELFLALKRLEKPVWLLNYNGEEHNLMERANCVDISKRETDFFDYFLMGKGKPQWITDGMPAIFKGMR